MTKMNTKLCPHSVLRSQGSFLGTQGGLFLRTALSGLAAFSVPTEESLVASLAGAGCWVGLCPQMPPAVEDENKSTKT